MEESIPFTIHYTKDKIKLTKKKQLKKNWIIIGKILIKSFFILVFITILLYSCLIKKKIRGTSFKKREQKNINTTEIIIEAQDYINFCISGKLLNKLPFKIADKPKISVIIPVYNAQNFIERTTRSIQNQKMLDIEIIFVNDKSIDKSLKKIREMKIIDPRIRLITNEYNKGTLYSRSIGALSAKGKYILPLDNDDMFSSNNIFNTLYEEAEKNNLDIIEFRSFQYKSYQLNKNNLENTLWNNHKENIIIIQPELSDFMYRINSNGVFCMMDVHLWGKYIKTTVYKNTLDFLGEKIFSTKIIWDEDKIINFVLLRKAKSFKFIGKFGIFRFKNKNSFTHKKNFSETVFSELFTTKLIIDLSRNNQQDKKIILLEISRNCKLVNSAKLDENNRKIYVVLIHQIFNSEIISPKDKVDLYKKCKLYNSSQFNNLTKSNYHNIF